MTIGKEFSLELRKLRHRHIPALFLLTFALIAAWVSWCLKDLDLSKTNDAAAMLFLNLLLMNTILCPVIVAALASRMCDMEQAGSAYRWLCTIQKTECIYRGKVMVGGFCMASFSLIQAVLFSSITASWGTNGQGRLAWITPSLFFTLFLTSLCIFIFQLNLSLRFTNQLTPIFVSIGGTFAGLFSWFLNRWPLRYLIPWGYYAALCNTGLEYDEAARYSTYYWTGYPVLWLAVLLAAIAILYYFGQKHFLETVRETM